MHTQLLLAGFILALAVGIIGLLIAEKVPSWKERRQLHLFIIGAPALLICTLALDIAYMAWVGCLFRTSEIDFILSAGWGLGLAGIAFVSLTRHALQAHKAGRVFAHLPTEKSQRAQKILSRLVNEGKHQPRLLIVAFFQPVAFTLGLFHPTIVLSSWVLENLDEDELEGVLAHEYAHCLYQDNLVMTMAAWLKDCTFYLFFVREAFQSLLAEKELLADAWAAEYTQKPAALASALYKFSTFPHPKLFSPSVETAIQGFGQNLIETRIEALLEQQKPTAAKVHTWELVVAMAFLLILAALPSYWMPMLH